MEKKFVSWLGHRLRELNVYLHFLTKLFCRPVFFISVSDSVSGFSSELRGKNLVKFWRNKGLNALLIPSQLEISQRARLSKLLKPQVVIHQKFRIAGNDPKLYPNSINILDLDDADFLDPALTSRMEASLKLCDGGIAGGRYTRKWMRNFIENTTIVWSGATQGSIKTQSKRKAHNVVWGVTAPLDSEEEALFIRFVLTQCSKTHSFEFIVIGRGNTDEINAFFEPVIANGNVTLVHYPFLPYNEYINILASGHVGLAPLFEKVNGFNNGKSFGKILAYLSVGVPVITTFAADHELFFANGVNGFISNQPEDWIEYIHRLLDDGELRKDIAEKATQDYLKRLTLEAYSQRVFDFVSEVYKNKTGNQLLPQKRKRTNYI